MYFCHHIPRQAVVCNSIRFCSDVLIIVQFEPIVAVKITKNNDGSWGSGSQHLPTWHINHIKWPIKARYSRHYRVLSNPILIRRGVPLRIYLIGEQWSAGSWVLPFKIANASKSPLFLCLSGPKSSHLSSEWACSTRQCDFMSTLASIFSGHNLSKWAVDLLEFGHGLWLVWELNGLTCWQAECIDLVLAGDTAWWKSEVIYWRGLQSAFTSVNIVAGFQHKRPSATGIIFYLCVASRVNPPKPTCGGRNQLVAAAVTARHNPHAWDGATLRVTTFTALYVITAVTDRRQRALPANSLINMHATSIQRGESNRCLSQK